MQDIYHAHTTTNTKKNHPIPLLIIMKLYMACAIRLGRKRNAVHVRLNLQSMEPIHPTSHTYLKELESSARS